VREGREPGRETKEGKRERRDEDEAKDNGAVAFTKRSLSVSPAKKQNLECRRVDVASSFFT
jgi:hypothetical protein